MAAQQPILARLLGPSARVVGGGLLQRGRDCRARVVVVGAVVDKLTTAGVIDKTYIFYSSGALALLLFGVCGSQPDALNSFVRLLLAVSDHGYKQGQWRFG